jgi:hypothetical protein
MAKTKISSVDLAWLFTEKLKLFGDCALSIAVAIIPSKGGWSVLANQRDLHSRPHCAKRIEQLQKELRKIYVLTMD